MCRLGSRKLDLWRQSAYKTADAGLSAGEITQITRKARTLSRAFCVSAPGKPHLIRRILRAALSLEGVAVAIVVAALCAIAYASR